MYFLTKIMNETVQEMPQTICVCCIRKLKSAYVFVQQAHDANEKLWSMVNEEQNINDKPINCLQEAQIDIQDCLEIKIEDDEEASDNKNEISKLDMELKEEETDDGSLNANKIMTKKSDKKDG